MPAEGSGITGPGGKNRMCCKNSRSDCYAWEIMAELRRPAIFKWRHFAPEVILCGVRWYLRYSLSYRVVQELLIEHGLEVAHTTIWRWVQHYAPELDERTRPHLKPTNKSWRVDKAYVRIKGRWFYCIARSTRREPRSTFSCRRFVPPMRPRYCLPRRWRTLLTLSPG